MYKKIEEQVVLFYIFLSFILSLQPASLNVLYSD